MQKRWKILDSVELTDLPDHSVKICILYQGGWTRMQEVIPKQVVEDIGRSGAILGTVNRILCKNELLLSEVKTVLRESYNIHA